MKALQLSACDMELDFAVSKRMADELAEVWLKDPTCLSWYDRDCDQESPGHVSECHTDACPVPGYIDYAQNRGAELKVDVASGRFVFCYRSLPMEE